MRKKQFLKWLLRKEGIIQLGPIPLLALSLSSFSIHSLVFLSLSLAFSLVFHFMIPSFAFSLFHLSHLTVSAFSLTYSSFYMLSLSYILTLFAPFSFPLFKNYFFNSFFLCLYFVLSLPCLISNFNLSQSFIYLLHHKRPL